MAEPVPTLTDQLLAMRSLRTRRRRRKPRKLRPVRYPRATELRYSKALRSLVDEIERMVRELVHPRLDGLLRRARIERGDGLAERHDEAADDLRALVEQLRAQFGSEVPDASLERIARQIFDEVNRKHVREFDEKYGGVLPIQTIGAPWERGQMSSFVAENVRLIKSMSFQTFDQVEGVLMRALSDGLRVEEVEKQLRDRFGVSRSRARFIARDQIGKAQGQINRLRQKDAGIESYTWSTSMDERVRPSHARLEGTEHRWNDPPVVDPKTGRRAHPGGDFRCRCSALPRISGLNDEE